MENLPQQLTAHPNGLMDPEPVTTCDTPAIRCAIQEQLQGSCAGKYHGFMPKPSHSLEELTAPWKAWKQEFGVDPNSGNWTLAQRVLTPQNVGHVVEQVEQKLSYAMQQPVYLPIDDQVVHTFTDLLIHNSGLTYNTNAVDEINEAAIGRILHERYYGLRQRKLYYRYFINQDRIRTFPWGEPTKVVRGEVDIMKDGYMLSHPWKSQQASYLRDVFTGGLERPTVAVPGQPDPRNCGYF